MIEGIELNIYFEDGDGIAVDLSPTQVETIFKALGMKFIKDDRITMFSDNTLRKHILPRINFQRLTTCDLPEQNEGEI